MKLPNLVSGAQKAWAGGVGSAVIAFLSVWQATGDWKQALMYGLAGSAAGAGVYAAPNKK